MTRRRTALVVAGIAVAIVGIAALASRPSVLARSDDGRVAVLDATYGTTAPWRVPLVNWFPALRVSRRLDGFFDGRPFLGLMVVGGGRDDFRIDGQCGCRFWMTPVVWGRGDVALGTETFPRRDPELRIRCGDDGPVVVIPNPAPLAPPVAGPEAEELPVTVQSGDVTWILTQRPSDPGQLAVQAVGADGSGFPWRFFSARMSDASGNVVQRMANDRQSREHRIPLPPRVGAWRLCPHEPWWELTVNVEGRAPVTFRFRPPR